MTKKYLITSALPYANGPLHFGHLAGAYLPADIYTRHRRYCGDKVAHICGSDEHGVAIMQNATKAKIPYQEYVDQWHQEHFEVFKSYQIEFDFFGQTSSDYHEKEVLEWFKILFDKGYIEKQADQQLQCQSCHNYLPDRYVEGTCYECDYPEARGDECPQCGTWIDSLKLINPVCKFCESRDIKAVEVDQWYLRLSKYHEEFRAWFENKKYWKKAVWNFVNSLSEEEMVDRAITRDLDWGIDVPLEEAKGKKLYVWFDAPIGYVSNTKKWLESIGSKENYLKDWWQNEDVEITNFIGKDNIIFHAIVFPMMSLASGRACAVHQLPANQYLNLAGKQFSKSKGWYVDSQEALDKVGVDALRYYLTTLIPESNDSSFEWEGLANRVNGELANNIGNLVSRCLGFAFKNWKEEGLGGEYFQAYWNSNEFEQLKKRTLQFHAFLNQFQIKDALQEVMGIGHDTNLYFSDRAPWAAIKQDKEHAAQTIAWTCLNIWTISSLLRPFLPHLCEKIHELFPLEWKESLNDVYQSQFESLKKLSQNSLVITQKPKPLVPRIEAELIEELNAKLKGSSTHG